MPDAGKRTTTEEQLVASLKNRERGAMGQLYDMYAAALYGGVYRIVRTDETAEDILQETFIKAWNNFGSYDPSKGRLFTWLVNIARHQALDNVKSKGSRNAQKNQDIDNIVGLIDEQSSTSYNPEQVGVREMLDKLDSEHQEIVDLVYFQGYTHSEVSKELGIPLGTVKTRLRAAINFFRKAFIQQ